jgi:outer membrane protein OmpA-like peptidoglycan-associated protein
MAGEKNRVLDDSNQIMVAARVVPFFMSFVMLFIIPFGPLLVSCQVPNTLVTSRGEGMVLPGHTTESTIISVIQGAAVGGTGGNIIARQMDVLASEITADLNGVSVERIAEGILITIDSRILFKDDGVDLLRAGKGKFKDLSRNLRAYEFTNILVESHTGNTAEESYNGHLSGRRALAVEKYLVGLGIRNGRIRSRGYTARWPKAPAPSRSIRPT